MFVVLRDVELGLRERRRPAAHRHVALVNRYAVERVRPT